MQASPESVLMHLVLAAVIQLLPLSLRASDDESVQFFEARIRPVLVKRCYSCHSSEASTIEGDYLLETRDGIRKGGVSKRDGVIPGDVEGSQLIEALRYGNEELQMPPGARLPDRVIADFEKWVAMGAPDPRDGVSRLPRQTVAKEHWAWKRPRRTPPPKVENEHWARDAIDVYILARLEANRMAPNPDADRRTLLRRATLELTGLPPTVSEIEAFLADTDDTPAALANVVDRLLTSPGFGVRWGRHWLDVARFGESSGYSRNMLYPYAWRFRNYVIDSFNADKPFNRFIREQIAGDLLPSDNDAQAQDQILGTGFLTIGAKTFNEGNPLLFALNCADDQIDATCRSFLALTVNCARCHDHKYDPISATDYYAMVGVFLSSRHLAGAETNVRNEHSQAFPLGPNGFQRLRDVEAAQAKATTAQSLYLDLVKTRNGLRDSLVKRGIDWKENPTPELQEAEARVQAQQSVVKQTEAAIPDPPEYGMAVVEGMTAKESEAFSEFLEKEKAEIAAMKKAGMRPKLPTPARPKIQDSRLYEQGLHDSPGHIVPRGVLTLFDYPAAPIGKDESGRRQLADWIADSRNPLTARVFVNRAWHHLFGRGLVETVDNFGVLGVQPTHAELLDMLALDFISSGWSTKELIRRIVLSRTWCQSSAYHPAHAAQDPDNTLLWRFQPHLLEGEAIRDSILQVSGSLDPVHLQGSQVADISKQKADGRQREIGRRSFYEQDVTWEVKHRSAYLPMARGKLPDVLATFDAADPNLVVGARKLTIVPMQALFLSNSRMVVNESAMTAKRITAHSTVDRLGDAYQLILGRLPTADERASVQTFLNASGESEKTWARICQTIICSGEFRTVY